MEKLAHGRSRKESDGEPEESVTKRRKMLPIQPAPPVPVVLTPNALVYTEWPSRRADPSDQHASFEIWNQSLLPAIANTFECQTRKPFRDFRLDAFSGRRAPCSRRCGWRVAASRCWRQPTHCYESLIAVR